MNHVILFVIFMILFIPFLYNLDKYLDHRMMIINYRILDDTTHERKLQYLFLSIILGSFSFFTLVVMLF